MCKLSWVFIATICSFSFLCSGEVILPENAGRKFIYANVENDARFTFVTYQDKKEEGTSVFLLENVAGEKDVSVKEFKIEKTFFDQNSIDALNVEGGNLAFLLENITGEKNASVKEFKIEKAFCGLDFIDALKFKGNVLVLWKKEYSPVIYFANLSESNPTARVLFKLGKQETLGSVHFTNRTLVLSNKNDWSLYLKIYKPLWTDEGKPLVGSEELLRVYCFDNIESNQDPQIQEWSLDDGKIFIARMDGQIVVWQRCGSPTNFFKSKIRRAVLEKTEINWSKSSNEMVINTFYVNSLNGSLGLIVEEIDDSLTNGSEQARVIRYSDFEMFNVAEGPPMSTRWRIFHLGKDSEWPWVITKKERKNPALEMYFFDSDVKEQKRFTVSLIPSKPLDDHCVLIRTNKVYFWGLRDGKLFNEKVEW